MQGQRARYHAAWLLPLSVFLRQWKSSFWHLGFKEILTFLMKHKHNLKGLTQVKFLKKKSVGLALWKPANAALRLKSYSCSVGEEILKRECTYRVVVLVINGLEIISSLLIITVPCCHRCLSYKCFESRAYGNQKKTPKLDTGWRRLSSWKNVFNVKSQSYIVVPTISQCIFIYSYMLNVLKSAQYAVLKWQQKFVLRNHCGF